jgi:hypothetical protein
MDYEDYAGRRWKVVTDTSTECPQGARVIFQGSASQVFVICEGTPRYGAGTYNASSHQIERADAYKISMTKGSNGNPTTITFAPESGRLSRRTTGSWTAEDNGAWPGED